MKKNLFRGLLVLLLVMMFTSCGDEIEKLDDQVEEVTMKDQAFQDSTDYKIAVERYNLKVYNEETGELVYDVVDPPFWGFLLILIIGMFLGVGVVILIVGP